MPRVLIRCLLTACVLCLSALAGCHVSDPRPAAKKATVAKADKKTPPAPDQPALAKATVPSKSDPTFSANLVMLDTDGPKFARPSTAVAQGVMPIPPWPDAVIEQQPKVDLPGLLPLGNVSAPIMTVVSEVPVSEPKVEQLPLLPSLPQVPVPEVAVVPPSAGPALPEVPLQKPLEVPLPDTAPVWQMQVPEPETSLCDLSTDNAPPVQPAPTALPSKDVAGPGGFGHAADYSWISGEVQTWRKECRLRYAAVDEADPYGGSVLLAGKLLATLKEGDHCKLIGRLVQNASKTGVVFHIDTVQPMNEK